MSVKITISGPGQTFDSEYCLIYKALKEAGFDIIEDNEYPPKESTKKNHNILFNVTNKKEIKLVAIHYPWGG